MNPKVIKIISDYVKSKLNDDQLKRTKKVIVHYPTEYDDSYYNSIDPIAIVIFDDFSEIDIDLFKIENDIIQAHNQSNKNEDEDYYEDEDEDYYFNNRPDSKFSFTLDE